SQVARHGFCTFFSSFPRSHCSSGCSGRVGGRPSDMTESYRPPLLIIADSPEALTDLCGISLLERMRRVAFQLGFREAMILSNSVKTVTAHVANESWRRADVSLTFRERAGAEVTVGDILDCLAALRVAADGRILIVFAGFYCDERLL